MRLAYPEYHSELMWRLKRSVATAGPKNCQNAVACACRTCGPLSVLVCQWMPHNNSDERSRSRPPDLCGIVPKNLVRRYVQSASLRARDGRAGSCRVQERKCVCSALANCGQGISAVPSKASASTNLPSASLHCDSFVMTMNGRDLSVSTVMAWPVGACICTRNFK